MIKSLDDHGTFATLSGNTDIPRVLLYLQALLKFFTFCFIFTSYFCETERDGDKLKGRAVLQGLRPPGPTQAQRTWAYVGSREL